jgi:arsenate reductase-like glutaredoxin family protein
MVKKLVKMLYQHQIWKHIHNSTKKDVEKEAVIELIRYFEIQIDEVINQSIIELKKINQFKNLQGLKTKKRIDKHCIKKAINVINDKNNFSPVKIGGEIQKIGEKYVKHTPNGKDKGVEIC